MIDTLCNFANLVITCSSLILFFLWFFMRLLSRCTLDTVHIHCGKVLSLFCMVYVQCHVQCHTVPLCIMYTLCYVYVYLYVLCTMSYIQYLSACLQLPDIRASNTTGQSISPPALHICPGVSFQGQIWRGNHSGATPWCLQYTRLESFTILTCLWRAATASAEACSCKIIKPNCQTQQIWEWHWLGSNCKLGMHQLNYVYIWSYN